MFTNELIKQFSSQSSFQRIFVGINYNSIVFWIYLSKPIRYNSSTNLMKSNCRSIAGTVWISFVYDVMANKYLMYLCVSELDSHIFMNQKIASGLASSWKFRYFQNIQVNLIYGKVHFAIFFVQLYLFVSVNLDIQNNRGYTHEKCKANEKSSERADILDWFKFERAAGLNLIVKARLVKGNYYKRNTTNPISLSVIWVLRL